jgi:hypothetical protein
MRLRHEDLPNIAIIAFVTNFCIFSLSLLISGVSIPLYKLALASFFSSCGVAIAILLYYEICGGYPITSAHVKSVLGKLRG